MVGENDVISVVPCSKYPGWKFQHALSHEVNTIKTRSRMYSVRSAAHGFLSFGVELASKVCRTETKQSGVQDTA
jgi:hypothetical protein